MRNVISVLAGSLLLMAASQGVLAQDVPRAMQDDAELSVTVKKLFSNDNCTMISENPRDGDAHGKLAIVFRLRCASEVASVSARLNELKNTDGFTVEEVALRSNGKSENKGPSVDVKFVAIALASVKG